MTRFVTNGVLLARAQRKSFKFNTQDVQRKVALGQQQTNRVGSKSDPKVSGSSEAATLPLSARHSSHLQLTPVLLYVQHRAAWIQSGYVALR